MVGIPIHHAVRRPSLCLISHRSRNALIPLLPIMAATFLTGTINFFGLTLLMKMVKWARKYMSVIAMVLLRSLLCWQRSGYWMDRSFLISM